MTAVVAAALAFAAVVAAVQLLGAWTLVLYRHGGFHRLQRATVDLHGVPAFVVDAVAAALCTFCGCMTHPVVRALHEASQGERAVRFLALSSTLRTGAAISIGVAVGGGAASPGSSIAAVLVALALWALCVERLSGDAPIAAASVFVPRVSSVPVSRAWSDAWIETRAMLRLYAWHIAVPAALFGVLAATSWRVDDGAALAALWALGGAVAGALVPVDLLSMLPLVVLAASRGVPVECIAPFALGVEAGSVRSRRVVDEYLSLDARTRWRTATRLLPFVVAVFVTLYG